MSDAAALDAIFRALADPTRRRIVAELAAGEARVSDIAEPLPMSLAAVSKHLRILEDAGVLQRVRRGREHLMSARPDALAAARRWLQDQEAFWHERLDALDAVLTEERGDE